MTSLITFLLFCSISFAKDVEIVTPDGILKGTFLEAKNSKDLALLIISGSGPTDRNGNSAVVSGSNNSLKMLAESLAKNGYPSLRYDKRGIAKSTGFPPESETNFSDFVDDAMLAANKLKEFGYKKIVIAGHSEGSLIASMIVPKVGAIGFISICGLAKNYSETIILQIEQRMPKFLERTKEIIDSLKSGESPEVINPTLKMMFRPSVYNFLQEVFVIEPQEKISKIECPVLVINGEHDAQVPPEDGKMLAKAANRSNYFSLDSMNHVLKNTPKDMMSQLSSYSNPNLPINEQLIKTIVDYLKDLE